MLFLRCLTSRRKPSRDQKSAVRFRRLLVRSEYREPLAVNYAGFDAGRGNGDGADELCAEDIVVLDGELDVIGEMGDGEIEVLVPYGVLGVGDDAGAR